MVVDDGAVVVVVVVDDAVAVGCQTQRVQLSFHILYFSFSFFV